MVVLSCPISVISQIEDLAQHELAQRFLPITGFAAENNPLETLDDILAEVTMLPRLVVILILSPSLTAIRDASSGWISA